jgi:hypothetical protein
LEIQNGRQEVFRLIFHCKMTHLSNHHHGDYIIIPIVFTLSEHAVLQISCIQNG